MIFKLVKGEGAETLTMALDAMNRDGYKDNLKFNVFDYKGWTKDGRVKFNIRIGCKKSRNPDRSLAPGAHFTSSGRATRWASWNTWGVFIRLLPGATEYRAFSRQKGKAVWLRADEPFVDVPNIGSIACPLYADKADLD